MLSTSSFAGCVRNCCWYKSKYRPLTSSNSSCAAFNDSARFDHQDQIRIVHRAQAVRDHDAGASGQQGLECPLNDRLGAGIDIGSGLIENQDARIADHRPGEAEQLALAEVVAALLQHRLVTLGQRGDKLVRVDGLRRRDQQQRDQRTTGLEFVITSGSKRPPDRFVASGRGFGTTSTLTCAGWTATGSRLRNCTASLRHLEPPNQP